MTQLDFRCIERDGAGLVGNGFNLAGRDKQELGFVINKSLDKPRTGDAVNMNV
jgi:hypothetical protein